MQLLIAYFRPPADHFPLSCDCCAVVVVHDYCLSTPSSVDIRTVPHPEHEEEAQTNDGQDDTRGVTGSKEKGVRGPLQHYVLDLRQEGEDQPPKACESGGGRIGTLSCAVLVHAEKNWKTEVSRCTLARQRNRATTGGGGILGQRVF